MVDKKKDADKNETTHEVIQRVDPMQDRHRANEKKKDADIEKLRKESDGKPKL